MIGSPRANPDPWVACQAEVVDCADVRIHLCSYLETRGLALDDE